MNKETKILGVLGLLVLCSSVLAVDGNEPIAHWKFDEDSGTTAYDSAGANHGTVHGATWTTGPIDGALQFDGKDDYVDCNTSPAIIGTGNFAISLWAKVIVPNKNQVLVNQRGSFSGDGSYILQIKKTNQVRFTVYNEGNGFEVMSKVKIDDGDWHHIVATRITSRRGNIYVDGAFAGTDYGSAKSLNNVPVVIGRWNGDGQYFNGPIDDVRIYNRALSDAEIEQLYLSGLPDVVSLEITGPQEVAENSEVRYTAIAYYDDNSTADVTDFSLWRAEPQVIAYMDSNDFNNISLLHTKRIEAAEHITIYAQYSERGITVEAEKIVQASPLTDLKIIGLQEVRGNCPQQYSLIAHYANGHTNDVTDLALWHVEPQSLATIDAGLLRTQEVNEPKDITIYAQYTSGGITLQIQMPIQALPPQTLYVPADYQTIQEAIDAAECGDTVIVADGTYTGPGNRDIDFLGKAIAVRSESGPQNCIIDCNGTWRDRHRGFYLHNGKEADSIIEGFTITNGFDWSGGAIYCKESSPTITNCIITGNTGGGIYCRYSNLIITNCTINDNGGVYYGGGIYCRDSSPTIANCTISGNTTEGSYTYGGGIYSSKGSPKITSCILWDNEALYGPQICLVDNTNASVSYTDIQGGQDDVYISSSCTLDWGRGNINSEPHFAFPTDYHLMPYSPCVDAGDPNYLPEPNETDIDGQPRIIGGQIDMGAYEYDPNSPAIAVSASIVSFYYAQDWSKPAPQPLLIKNYGGKPLHWEIVEDCNWLRVRPTIGVSTGQISKVTLMVEPNSLPPGYYGCILTVLDQNAANSPVTVQVTLRVGALLHVPSQDFPTIQAAIDTARDFDMVLVADGTYIGPGNRDIDFLGKAITVKSESGPRFTIIDCENVTRGFFFHNDETQDSVLDGFTITNGYSEYYRGGITCWDSSPTITNCIMTNNTDCGIYCYKNKPIITNCFITNNTRGGIRGDDSSLTIINSIIRDNTAGHGGGIDLEGGHSIITDCNITANSTKDDGGGIYFRERCGLGSLTITNCTISGNSAEGRSARGGGISYGAGRWGGPIITNCTISDNWAEHTGGGIFCYCYAGTPTITNCTITGNTAEGNGGGLTCWSGKNMVISNCIFWFNEAPDGPQIYLDYGTNASISYTDIQGDQADVYIGSTCILDWGLGNIGDDPLFVSSAIDDYHLSEFSPCINAGNPNFLVDHKETDIDNQPRVIGGRVDMGSDEFHGNNSAPVADAGEDQIAHAWLDGMAEVILNGTGSYDDDGHRLTYFWHWTVHGNSFTATGATIIIDLPLGKHTIELIVNDRLEDSEPDEVIITVIEPIEAQVWVVPQTINYYSPHPKIMARLLLPEGLTRDQIDSDALIILYPGSIEAMRQFIIPKRGKDSQRVSIFAFFDKAKLMDVLDTNSRVELQIIGQLKTGQYFYGYDTIRIITRPSKPRPRRGRK